MIISEQKCYMCDKNASSREHVPPKCIFPEIKDIQEQNLRKDLITVPACEKHNLVKSKDDEFLMVSLAGILGNNSIGYMHQITKVNRAIKRSSSRLLKDVFLKKKKYKVKVENNKYIEVILGKPDLERLKNCFQHIAYGIYYHHFDKKFDGKIKSIFGFLYNTKKDAETFKNFIRHGVSLELKGKDKFGENPEVFYYQFTDPDQFGLITLKTCFYNGVDVYTAFIPKDAEVFNLGAMFIADGIKTSIQLEDKIYEFN